MLGFRNFRTSKLQFRSSLVLNVPFCFAKKGQNSYYFINLFLIRTCFIVLDNRPLLKRHKIPFETMSCKRNVSLCTFIGNQLIHATNPHFDISYQLLNFANLSLILRALFMYVDVSSDSACKTSREQVSRKAKQDNSSSYCVR